MKLEEITEWASLIFLIDDSKLRSSKHQRQIKLIQGAIKSLKENPTPEALQQLLVLKPISCRGTTEHVAQCRYLQHCVRVLVNRVHLNEGGVEK